MCSVQIHVIVLTHVYVRIYLCLCLQYGIPLKVLQYSELYNWTMDDIVKAIGRKNNCTFCGVFRRQVRDVPIA